MLKNNFKEIKNKIKCNISDIINTELLRASEQFGIFHSTHEGFGVMNEEFDELKDELNFIQIEMDTLWRQVKYNNRKSMYNTIKNIQIFSEKAVYECTQLSAMARRFEIDLTQLDKNNKK